MARLDHRVLEWLVDQCAQTVDVDAQAVGIRQFFAPDAGFDVLTGDDSRRGFHQRLENLQRGWVELQQLAFATDFQCVEVVLEIAHGEDAGLDATAAALQGIQANFHFLQRKWLDQVIVSAGIEASELIFERVPCGEHQDRSLLAGFVTELFGHFQAIETWQVEIEHNGVKIVHHGEVQPGDAVSREIDRMATFFQKIAKVCRNVLIVFNNQNAHGVPFLFLWVHLTIRHSFNIWNHLLNKKTRTT